MNRHHHNQGASVSNAEHTAKAGFFAVLSDLLGFRGSGAGFWGGRTSTLRLAFLTAFVAAAFLALTAAPASAATAYKQIGEITGPEAGVSFESLKSESVAVNDHNGHVYVAVSAVAACPNEQLRVESNPAALPDCRAYEQVMLPFMTPAQPTTTPEPPSPRQ
jgi:hypothetical protein